MRPALVWLLFAALVVYNGVDVYQTKMLFDIGAVEANPILRALIDYTGTWRAIVASKSVVLIVLGVFIHLHLRKIEGEQT